LGGGIEIESAAERNSAGVDDAKDQALNLGGGHGREILWKYESLMTRDPAPLRGAKFYSILSGGVTPG
jgi:hypothetical protein